MAKKKTVSKENSFTEILLYNTPNGKVKVEIYLHNKTVWLTQQKIAELFAVGRSLITKHIGNVFKEGELNEISNVQKMHIANADRPRDFL